SCEDLGLGSVRSLYREPETPSLSRLLFPVPDEAQERDMQVCLGFHGIDDSRTAP
ncbi:hypothetical protein P7K49_003079, partial [Saguinus oedipus]